jgi:hypothetical protein
MLKRFATNSLSTPTKRRKMIDWRPFLREVLDVMDGTEEPLDMVIAKEFNAGFNIEIYKEISEPIANRE